MFASSTKVREIPKPFFNDRAYPRVSGAKAQNSGLNQVDNPKGTLAYILILMSTEQNCQNCPMARLWAKELREVNAGELIDELILSVASSSYVDEQGEQQRLNLIYRSMQLGKLLGLINKTVRS